MDHVAELELRVIDPMFPFSYTALGLAASFKPQASGGVEGAKTRKGLNEGHDITTPGEPSTSTRKDTKKGVPKGHARIIRDSDGNVVGIEEAEAEDEEMEESESDQLIEDKASRLDPDTMEWVTMGREAGKELSETTVVQGESFDRIGLLSRSDTEHFANHTILRSVF